MRAARRVCGGMMSLSSSRPAGVPARLRRRSYTHFLLEEDPSTTSTFIVPIVIRAFMFSMVISPSLPVLISNDTLACGCRRRTPPPHTPTRARTSQLRAQPHRGTHERRHEPRAEERAQPGGAASQPAGELSRPGKRDSQSCRTPRAAPAPPRPAALTATSEMDTDACPSSLALGKEVLW